MVWRLFELFRICLSTLSIATAKTTRRGSGFHPIPGSWAKKQPSQRELRAVAAKTEMLNCPNKNGTAASLEEAFVYIFRFPH
jgi:hypothetical protein